MSFWQKFLASFLLVKDTAINSNNQGAGHYLDIISLDEDSQRAFKFGLLYSKRTLLDLWRPFFAKNFKTKGFQSINVIVPSANLDLETTAIKNSIAELSLRPVQTIKRSNFLNDYLLKNKNYSNLKLIIDLATDFIEISLFLNQEKIKEQTLNWGIEDFKELLVSYCFDQEVAQLTSGELNKLLNAVLSAKETKILFKAKDLKTGKMRNIELDLLKIRKIIKSELNKLINTLEIFVKDLPVKLLDQNWQHYYLFMPDLQSVLLEDHLNQSLHLEGIIEKGVITDYA